MRTIAALRTFALIALATGCDNPGERADGPPRRAVLTAGTSGAIVIANRTPRPIAELHLSRVAERSWEPNLLAAPLPPGGDASAPRPPCAHYDVLVVRGDGARCVLPNTSLCFAVESWRIHDVTLEACAWRR